MPTDYDAISHAYKRSKEAFWRAYSETPSFLGLVGDTAGLSVLDLACGDGFYTRRLATAGASRVVGVDSAAAMIALARGSDDGSASIEYHVADARSLDLGEQFDLVTAAFLLNYASDAGELLEMCQSIARHLRPGGRFVAIDSHPVVEPGIDYRPYGFERILPARLQNGSAFTWRNYQDGSSFDIVVYHLDTATHDRTFAEAGLQDVRWTDPTVTDEGMAAFEPGFWDTFLRHPPVVLVECRAG
jgi:ubiquinone/menaquinone biosynthesis C-methylase UbiE